VIVVIKLAVAQNTGNFASGCTTVASPVVPSPFS
jgi:hypothetical protein